MSQTNLNVGNLCLSYIQVIGHYENHFYLYFVIFNVIVFTDYGKILNIIIVI